MKRIYFCLFIMVAVLMLDASLNEAKAALKIPQCDALEQWVSEIPSSHGGKSSRKVKIEHLFTDEKIVPVFGLSFQEWSQTEADIIYGTLVSCAEEADVRGDNRTRNRLELVARKLEQTQRLRRTGFKEPECVFVYQWIARSNKLSGSFSEKLSEENQNRVLFTDSYIVPLFGKPYKNWDRDNRKKAKGILAACSARMSEKSDERIADGLDMAIRYINSRD